MNDLFVRSSFVHETDTEFVLGSGVDVNPDEPTAAWILLHKFFGQLRELVNRGRPVFFVGAEFPSASDRLGEGAETNSFAHDELLYEVR